MSDLLDGRQSTLLGGVTRTPALAEGLAALERADWEVARAFFMNALSTERTPEGLEALGMAASLCHEEQQAFEARETAFELYRRAGDRLGAGRVALWLTVDNVEFRGAIALANGWLHRAHTVLDGLPQSAEHGWLALIEAQKALYAENDSHAASSHAAAAVRIARTTGDSDLEANALAVEGLARVTCGFIQQGISRLDEAGAACLSGEVRAPWVVSAVLCNLMDACDRTRDWDRAREWFEHVTRLAMRWNNHLFHAQCRPHYAVVLTWRGAWQEAESELQLAIDEMSAVRKPMATEGIVRLAELRWRQGRWEEAATLFEQVKHEPLAQLGLGTLCLDQGDSAQALVLAERCLRRLPGGDRLERLPALDLYIRACLALGDCDRAREAVPELEEIAGAVATRPVRATAHLALGLIAAASGDTERARYEIEDAVDLFEAAQAPFEASRARYELARVLRALGLPADAARQGRIALETLTALGARQEAERAAQLISLAASEPAPIDSIAELSRRETEVLGLLAAGLSNQEIAERLVLSIRTVQRHIENIYTKTGARGRAAAAVFAITHGLVPPGP